MVVLDVVLNLTLFQCNISYTANTDGTRLFDGEPGHLVPSASHFLVESDMFIMAGRMVGHSFVHGGPCLSGLSPAVVHVLLGGSPETATVTLEDCPDLDIRETIRLVCFQSNPIISSLIYTLKQESLHPFSYFFLCAVLYCGKKAKGVVNFYTHRVVSDVRHTFFHSISSSLCVFKLEGESEISDEGKRSVRDLAFASDLPCLTGNNRRWLFEKMLIHAVREML